MEECKSVKEALVFVSVKPDFNNILLLSRILVHINFIFKSQNLVGCILITKLRNISQELSEHLTFLFIYIFHQFRIFLKKLDRCPWGTKDLLDQMRDSDSILFLHELNASKSECYSIYGDDACLNIALRLRIGITWGYYIRAHHLLHVLEHAMSCFFH